MSTAAKPKKRSRLALPRQKGPSAAMAGSGVPRSSAAAGQDGSRQQREQASAVVVAADGKGKGRDKGASTISAPGASSSNSVGLRPTPAASPAGVVGDGDSGLQAVPPPAASATTGDDRRFPDAGTTTVNGEGQREHQQQQPVPATRKGQEHVGREKEEEGEERRVVECHAGGSSNSNSSAKKHPRRDPLQNLRLNGRSEVTAAGAGGKGLQQAAATAAIGAAAVVAAAASEVSQLLDGLELRDQLGCRPSNVPAVSPPMAPERRAGSRGNNQRRIGGTSEAARSDLQHQQQSAGRKRPRPATAAAAVPSASSRMASLPSSASRGAPAPPSPKRGRAPAATVAAAAATTTARTMTTTEEEAVEDVVMLNSGHEAEEEPRLALAPTKPPGGGGRGRSSASGEREDAAAAAAADDRRPALPSSLEEEEGPSPKQRERCPVCSCAVWGLSVRARQVHINSCLDGTAAGASGPVTGGGAGAGAGAGVSDRGRGTSAAPAGRRSSAGATAPVAQEPKTEYQEHIQMAKALSRSLVEPPTRAAAAAPAGQDEETEEELVRNPAAFRAKENRLVRGLKDLDAKLERLNKDRDTTLRKLAAHRALGARASATVSAGAVLSGENGGGGGAPKTAEEVVDFIFPAEEHVATANDRPSERRSEGRRQKRQAAMPPPAGAAATGAPPAPDTETACTAANAAAAAAAAAAEMRPRTSRGRDPEETAPHDEVGWGRGGAQQEEPVGVAAGNVRSAAAARGGASPSCVGDDCGGSEGHRDGTGDDDDDVDDVGGARLIRRRSSGGVGLGGGGGDGRLLSSSAGKREEGKRRRTFWGIAQDADELSQSNFVTGVFADIRAESTAATAGAGGQPARKVGTVTAAAAYGDASLYTRRARSSRPASPCAGAGADTAATAAVSTPLPNLGPGLGDTRARVDDGNGNGASGANETNTPDGDCSSSEIDDGSGCDEEAVDAVDGAILLLSQTLSAGHHPRPTSAVRVPTPPQKLIPSESADTPPRRSSSSTTASPGEKGEKDGEDGEAAKVAARHIANAPVRAVARVFPNWEENVRFVFRQGAAELREALRSIDAALSEEQAAVAAAAAAATASPDSQCALGGDSGRRGKGLSVARGPPERHPGGGGSSGGVGGGDSSKAEALLFFEGLILEALDLKGSVVPSREGLPPSIRGNEGEDANRSGGGRSSGDPESDIDKPNGCAAGREGGEKSIGDAAAVGARSRPHDTELARQEKEKEKEDTQGRRDDAVERPPAAGAEVTAEETLDVDSGEALNDGHVSPSVGEAGDGQTEEDRRSGGLLRGKRDSVETVVLSGDSCRDAVVTFDLTSPEPVKSRPRTASTVAAAAADGVLIGAPSGAAVDPPDCGEGHENGRSGSPHRGTSSSVGNDENVKDDGVGGDDGGDDDDFAIVANGGEVGSEAGGGVDDEYPLDEEDGFVDDYYCAWDDNDNGDFSVFPSPDDGGAPDEEIGPPLSPLSPTQRPSPLAFGKQGTGDICGGAAGGVDVGCGGGDGGGGGGGTASCDAPGMDADVLDLTQVAPSPVPSSRPGRGGGSESTVAAAAAAVPVRNRPPHQTHESSSVRRDHDDTASPPSEKEEEEEEDVVVEQGAAARISEHDDDGPGEVMPSFSEMTLQELAGMMAVYGLKKKSKREMTQRLELIWKTLHPAEAAAAAAAAGQVVSAAGRRGTSASSAGSASQRRRAAGAGRASTLPTAASARSQGRPPLARSARGTGGGTGGGGREGDSSHKSTRALGGQRHQAGEGETEDDGSTAVTPRPPSSARPCAARSAGGEEATAAAALGARIRAVITGFAPLHEDILLLRTIELSATQSLLKDKGVKCSKKDLGTYLDARGITFVDRGGTKRGGGGGGGQEEEGGGRAPKKKKKKQTRCDRETSGEQGFS